MSMNHAFRMENEDGSALRSARPDGKGGNSPRKMFRRDATSGYVSVRTMVAHPTCEHALMSSLYLHRCFSVSGRARLTCGRGQGRAGSMPVPDDSVSVVLDCALAQARTNSASPKQALGVSESSAVRRESNSICCDSNSIRCDCKSICGESNSICCDFNSSRCNSNSIGRDSNSICCNSNSIRYESNSIFPESNSTCCNFNAICWKSISICCNSNSVRCDFNSICCKSNSIRCNPNSVRCESSSIRCGSTAAAAKHAGFAARHARSTADAVGLAATEPRSAAIRPHRARNSFGPHRNKPEFFGQYSARVCRTFVFLRRGNPAPSSRTGGQRAQACPSKHPDGFCEALG